MTGIMLGTLALVVSYLSFDETERRNLQELSFIPALIGVVGVVAIVAGVFSIA